ncbi:motility associated factor glycosyltransferase family protein [Lysinibacillus sp. NPDC093190]|uniref:motility associated factor glycosyltransferase family protein n=1 Tax=Lysinibacillus sp. NPDC093190 TaxID=3390575 RepID=UPI003D06FD2D
MMKWSLEKAKNGESTLQLNGVTIYSKYRPIDDAKRWINAECDTKSEEYFMIGLGLGYHLKALVESTQGKRITVYYFEQQELELFLLKNSNETWWQQENIKIVHDLNNSSIHADMQILIPNVWLQAIGENHPLFNILDIIKNNQIAYKKDAKLMANNFNENIKLGDDCHYPKPTKKVACLVAAGPSLDETIHWLKDKQKYVDIYVVGAVLKKLLDQNIEPTATIISDANNVIENQLYNSNFTGDLFYLSTANNKAVSTYNGKRYILFQQGYRLAEEVAREKQCLLIETGGSVGTTTFSLLELIGYQSIILFGQDLGFTGKQSHATSATSIELKYTKEVRTVLANDGCRINTTSNLYAFLHWYNEKMNCTNIKVYNTAKMGAKINNVPLVNHEEFIDIVKK